MENQKKFFVVAGASLGKLTIVGPVQDIFHHPLRESTPKSYIKQGYLWECACECGKHVLISEYILSKGENKSCGCLRKTKTGPDWDRRQKGLELKLKKMEINALIKRLSYELQEHKSTDSRFRNEARMQECAAELRSAYAKKASLAAQYHSNGNRKEKERKFTNVSKIDHLREVGVLDDWEARALEHAARINSQKQGLS